MRHYIYDNIGEFFNDRYKRGEEVLSEKKHYAIDMLTTAAPSSSKQPLKVLDLGCGSGRITEILIEKGYDVTGADISTIAIEKLKERGIDGFVHDVKNKLNSEDNQYDVIFATDLLELVPDIFLFLSEVRRVSKNNALFVFSTINLGWLPFRMKSLFGKSSSDMMPPSHCRFWTKSAVNYFMNNEFYQMVKWGGVIVLPKKIFGRFSRIRIKSVNIFSREIIGVAKVINKV